MHPASYSYASALKWPCACGFPPRAGGAGSQVDVRSAKLGSAGGCYSFDSIADLVLSLSMFDAFTASVDKGTWLIYNLCFHWKNTFTICVLEESFKRRSENLKIRRSVGGKVKTQCSFIYYFRNATVLKLISLF